MFVVSGEDVCFKGCVCVCVTLASNSALKDASRDPHRIDCIHHATFTFLCNNFLISVFSFTLETYLISFLVVFVSSLFVCFVKMFLFL